MHNPSCTSHIPVQTLRHTLDAPSAPVLPPLSDKEAAQKSTAAADAPARSAASRMPTALLWLSRVYTRRLRALQGKASATSFMAAARVRAGRPDQEGCVRAQSCRAKPMQRTLTGCSAPSTPGRLIHAPGIPAMVGAW